MRLAIYTFFLIIFISLYSCIGESSREYRELKGIAYPIELSKDVNSINLSEYLDKDIRMLKLKTDKNIDSKLSNDSINISLKTNKLTPPLTNLRVKTTDGNYDILVKNSKFNKKNTLSPHIYGETLEDNEIHFTIDNKHDSIFAYANNRLLSRKNILEEEGIYTLQIPRQLDKLNNSFIRIYAFSYQGGISNEFIVPISNGSTIKNTNQLDSLGSSNNNFEELYKDKDYFNIYQVALNTFMYYKYNCNHIDSLLNITIYKNGLYRISTPSTIVKNYLPLRSSLSIADTTLSEKLIKYKKAKSLKRAHKGIDQLNAFLMTIPGPPSYYLKPVREVKNPSKQEFSFAKVEELRKTNLSLIYGSFESLRQDVLTYAYVRKYFDEFAIVVFNRSKFMKKRKINLHTSFIDAQAKALFNSKFDITKGKLIVELQPYSVEIITGKITK